MANIYRKIAIHRLTELLSDPFADQLTDPGTIIFANQPTSDQNQRNAETGTTNQDALRQATTYANFARRQDVYVNKAKGDNVTAYTIALIDWFGAPKVLEINVDHWTGQIGQTIRVKARDNVRVASVFVVIRDADENVVEMGEAVQVEVGSPWWNYTTTSHIKITPFPFVEAIAQDLAGNRDAFVIS